MITELFPIVSTQDMSRALGFYGDMLGGVVAYEFPGPMVNLPTSASTWVRRTWGFGLSPQVTGGPPPRPISLWVYTDECDAVVERLRAAGVTITEEPSDHPWGERVARVLDPDGNEVIIGARAATGT